MAKKCYECKQGAQEEDYDDDIVKCQVTDPTTMKSKTVNLCFHHRFNGDFVWEGYQIVEIEKLSPKKMSIPVATCKTMPTRWPAGVMVGTASWYSHMDDVVRYWTGWESLREMCANNPTLAVTKNSNENEAAAIREMRDAYKFVNGREAYPANGTYGSGI
jgi:hypothetical protein